MKITSIRGRRVWDSRGNPTVEVDVVLESGAVGRAIAPAGASRGKREAIDLRDGGGRVGGFDVSKAVGSVNGAIAGALVGHDVADQSAIDNLLIQLDGTDNKANLGANATVATSMACMQAAAQAQARPLWAHVAQVYGTQPSVPLPEIQIFGGGAHAFGRVDIQDFMVMVPGADTFDEMMEITREVYFAAGDILKSKGKRSGVADEGGWWPNFDSNEEALETLVRAIELAGEKPGERVGISLDIAASEFYQNGEYKLALENRAFGTEKLIDLLGNWLSDYPILSIEDPVDEDDRDGMIEFTRRFGAQVQIIGDDYLVTNARAVQQAVDDQACNAVLVKVNQAGTVSEAVQAALTARGSGWGAVVSARSGETEDVFISHLSTGLGMGQLKVGSFTRSERMAKWNECLRISESLKDYAAGRSMQNTWWGS